MMYHIPFYWFLILSLFGPAAGLLGRGTDGDVSAGGQALAEGNRAFALALYGRLAHHEGNLFFSPYSISSALAMTYGGARGDTEKQMAGVLHFSEDQKAVHAAFSGLNGRLNAIEGEGHVKLSVANALWIEREFTILKEFMTLTQSFYQAAVHAVDFKTAHEAVRARINAWIEERTHDKIKDMIPAGVLSPLTRLVLANAIYFKGNWAHPFDEKQTKEAPFYRLNGKTAAVPMMRRTGKYPYGETPDFQILELPYAGDRLSMVIFLPRTRDGLPALEKDLTPSKLTAWTRQLVRREVRVLFPRFRMTSEFSLGDTLAAMGMPDAFCDRADFSGISRAEFVYISAVIHKAFIEVNEEGTEAAAATAVAIAATAAREAPPVFRADHPFIFMIREKGSDSILFLGRIVNPREAS